MPEENIQSTRKEMLEGLKDMDANRHLMEASFDSSSSLLFIRYRSLCKAGFSEEQAFQIVLHKGMLI